MNIFYGAISISAALGIFKFMGMDISWLMAAIPLILYGILTVFSTIVFQAAFNGATAALSVLAMEELTPEEMQSIMDGQELTQEEMQAFLDELKKTGQDDENGTNI